MITHSLSGGSGSGMVLPVLEHVRRTFGSEPVVWVISVGEGMSEDNEKSKINSPFIVSDVLQAHFDGVHAIAKPLELSDFSSFIYDIKSAQEKLSASSSKLLCEVLQDGKSIEEIENPVKEIVDATKGRKEIFAQYLKSTQKLELAKNNLKSESGEYQLEATGVSKDKIENFLQQTEPIGSKQFVDMLCESLPNDQNSAKQFTAWCRIEKTGASARRLSFWNNWRDLAIDPLSLLFRGKKAEARKDHESDEDRRQEHYEPTLTGDQLRQVALHLYKDNLPDNVLSKNVKNSAAELMPLFSELNDRVLQSENNREEILIKIKNTLDDYALQLDSFNNSKRQMDRRILSLSGLGSDKGVKSLIVSNAHLELGVKNSDNVESARRFTRFLIL